MAAMSDRQLRRLTVDGVEIGDQRECYVIAEVGHNHQGDIALAKRLVDAAKECGVNAVKLQKRSNRTLYTREFYEQPYDNELSFGRTYGEHREALELGADDYRELLRHAREVGMTLFATAFDFESADLLAELDVPAFKFASGDLRNTPLQRHVAAFGKPMFLSTGGGSLEDVERAVSTIVPLNDQLCVLQCTAAYPASAEDLNLNVITTLRERFPQLVIGLSDHQNGISMALVAYMLGARVIEKHFTLDHALKGRDHAFSLMPEGMRRLVRDLHRVPAALGDPTKRPLPIEADPLEKMGKKLVAARELELGHVLTASDLAIKSPADGGLPPYELDRLVGRRLRRPIACEDFVTFDDVEPIPEHAGAHAAAQP
jgi:sialic acid synthase